MDTMELNCSENFSDDLDMVDTMELNCSENFSDDLDRGRSLLTVNSIKRDLLGKHKIFPRIGDEYQAEIPVLLEKSDYIYYESGNEYKGESLVLIEKSDYIYYEKGEEKKDKFGFEIFKLTKSINNHSEVTELEPYYSASHWNEADKASFLLGLHIFARNFVQLKRFLVSKRMLDILSYYYGEFYKSHEYRRWSESRKMRGRGVVGRKIFTQPRKQELMSRILPGMTVEGRNATSKVCKMFGNRKIKFEKFIFLIRDLVGINVLVEAVGIGKGKKDLTTMVNEFIPVLPIGKAWSSLKLGDIVKYLNGDYPLTKAHSYDLFWEAVWPRLLARGWNSEQPKRRQVYTGGSKVFLVPGITNFCRRSLKKGNHYFDRETDVLNKVASDPCLIELESDEDESKGNEEEHEMKKEGDRLPSKKHCYLQPHTTNHTTEFSVEELGDVDTHVSNEACSTDDSKGSVNLSNLASLSDMKDLDSLESMQVLCPCPDSGSVHANENEDNLHNIAPVIKRRRLSGCNSAETRNDMTGMAEVGVKRGQEIPGSVMMNIPVVVPDSQAGPQIQNTFDLNLTPECENETECNGEHDEITKGQLNDVNIQRRGTRNRPPTARALEAIACGFLNNKRGDRARKPTSRPSRRAQGMKEVSDAQINRLAPTIQDSQSDPNTDSKML